MKTKELEMPRRRTNEVPFTLFAFQDIITSVTGIMLLVTLMLMLDLLSRTEKSAPVVTEKVADEIESATQSDKREIATLREQLKRSELTLGMNATEIARKISDLEASLSLIREDRQRSERLRATTDQQRKEVEEKSLSREITATKLQNLREQIRTVSRELEKMRQRNRVIYHTAPGTHSKSWLLELDRDQISVAEVGRKSPPIVFRQLEGLLEWANQRNPKSDLFVMLVKPTSITLFDQLKEQLTSKGFSLGYDLLAADATAIDPELGAGTSEP
jgi:hypothetical protein